MDGCGALCCPVVEVEDLCPCADVFAGEVVPEARTGFHGQGHVGGDLPEGHEWHPPDLGKDIGTAWLLEPVRTIENEVEVPPGRGI